jgi:hypothetical protein
MPFRDDMAKSTWHSARFGRFDFVIWGVETGMANGGTGKKHDVGRLCAD